MLLRLRLLLHLAMNHQKQLTQLLLLLMRLPVKLRLMKPLMRLLRLTPLLLLRPQLRLMRLPVKLRLMKPLMRLQLQRWTQMTR